ncbi:hypothetical protein WR25_00496 [Diploscapter pachys]|uniref:Vacuolar ATPase assembly protein VMA22 n=1 Tax=Diploscapter pachys TaxID=2018661 RepID=A0A2A2KYA6_9BILA|nr:hypothetical protein WR25_00496 [Diploscapter pachys]
MEASNELAFRRLELINEYVKLFKQLEAYLTSSRFGISKAKHLNGYTSVALPNEDSDEMASSIKVQTTKNKVELISDKDSEEDDAKTKPQFRPFGILEPSCAKQARKDIKRSIEIACDLATIQLELFKVEHDLVDSMKKLNVDEKS